MGARGLGAALLPPYGGGSGQGSREDSAAAGGPAPSFASSLTRQPSEPAASLPAAAGEEVEVLRGWTGARGSRGSGGAEPIAGLAGPGVVSGEARGLAASGRVLHTLA